MNTFVPVGGFTQTFTKYPQSCYPTQVQPKCAQQVQVQQCFKPQKPKCSPCDTSKPLWILGAIVLAGLLIWLISWAVSSTCKKNGPAPGPAPAPTPAPPGRPATVHATAPAVTLPTAAASAIAGAAAGAAAAAQKPAAPAATATAAMVPQNAQAIDKPTFDSLKANNQAFVVMFYSEGCGYCKMAFPHFDAAAQKCALPMFFVHQRNVTAQDGIRGVPVIRAYHSNGTTEDHVGSRDTATIQKFVNNAAQKNPAQAAQFQAQKNAAGHAQGHGKGKGKGALASAFANNNKSNSIHWRSSKSGHRHSH